MWRSVGDADGGTAAGTGVRHPVAAAIAVVVVALVALFGMVPATVGAQEYPPTPTSMVPSDPNPAPGEEITLTATGYQPGSTVTFTVGGEIVPASFSSSEPSAQANAAVFDPHTAGAPRVRQVQAVQGGTVIGTAVADATGTATLRWRVPPGTRPGTLTILASGTGANGLPLVTSTTITVTASGGGGGGGGAAADSTTTSSIAGSTTTTTRAATTTTTASGGGSSGEKSDSGWSVALRIGLIALAVLALLLVLFLLLSRRRRTGAATEAAAGAAADAETETATDDGSADGSSDGPSEPSGGEDDLD